MFVSVLSFVFVFVFVRPGWKGELWYLERPLSDFPSAAENFSELEENYWATAKDLQNSNKFFIHLYVFFLETLSMFHKIAINPSSLPSFQLPAECLMAKIAAVFYDKDQQLLMSWIKICSLFYIKQYVAIRLSSENLWHLKIEIVWKRSSKQDVAKQWSSNSCGKTKKLK